VLRDNVVPSRERPINSVFPILRSYRTVRIVTECYLDTHVAIGILKDPRKQQPRARVRNCWKVAWQCLDLQIRCLPSPGTAIRDPIRASALDVGRVPKGLLAGSGASAQNETGAQVTEPPTEMVILAVPVLGAHFLTGVQADTPLRSLVVRTDIESRFSRLPARVLHPPLVAPRPVSFVPRLAVADFVGITPFYCHIPDEPHR